MRHLVLTVCASASNYNKIITLSGDIEALGIDVVLPSTAERMKREGYDNIEAITDWASDPKGYEHKTRVMREHFAEIAKGDAILVANFPKQEKSNYIGPNVLMEMAVAFHLHKPIYILFDIPTDSPFIDEIIGMQPIALHGTVGSLSGHDG